MSFAFCVLHKAKNFENFETMRCPYNTIFLAQNVLKHSVKFTGNRELFLSRSIFGIEQGKIQVNGENNPISV